METTVETKEVTDDKVALEFPTGDLVVTIKVHDSRFEPLAWVSRAVDMPSTGRVTDYLYSTGDEIIATDAKRMHCFTPAPLPAGFWRPIKRTKAVLQFRKEEFDGKYPDYKKLIPDITREHRELKLEGDNIHLIYADIIRAMLPGVSGSKSIIDSLNFYYLNDIISNTRPFRVHMNDQGKVLYFVAVNQWALIMPLHDNRK